MYIDKLFKLLMREILKTVYLIKHESQFEKLTNNLWRILKDEQFIICKKMY